MKISQPTWFVYFVRCADNSLYGGITTDLTRRLKEHNGDNKKGAKYTRARRPVKLVFSESHPDKSSAAKREYAIKQLTKQAKEALIK
ncbi:GIY-YIG nuclease family protein [Thalassotalea sp. LPB0316]|uniref:GIY-YIG nuclease family protein n=1 Tax=Thalassotalea sp. LPB0316 TaxID=2769490 RepID=UPI00186758F6|nr:GIY-YIG nuclease family protein [Thalassotalea sp. LPB0316]QOL26624.1 GIY-YIG nuclease family protein [Thalassotalea sp. LPB0316]